MQSSWSFTRVRTVLMILVAVWLGVPRVFGQETALDPQRAAFLPLDDTGAFIHLAPGLIPTTNGCTEFTVSVVATFTDARVFGLRFFFDEANLDLISVTPGSDPTLHLMPDLLRLDTLWLDGFFHPNYAAGSVTVATLRVRAIAPADVSTRIGFLFGEGFGGTADNPDPIIFSGDTTYVPIEGTQPLAPQQLILQRMPYPAQEDSVCLRWQPVRYDADGDTVINPLYSVYREDVKNAPFIYDSIGATYDTFFYSDFVKYVFNPDSVFPWDSVVVNIATFQVHACKTQP